MLAITIQDLRFRGRQFLIAVGGAGLVFAMTLLLTGLAAGFRVEIVQTVQAMGAQSWVVGAGAAALAVTVVSRVLTGSYLPYLTWTPLLALAISVLALSGLSSVGPTALILARPEGADLGKAWGFAAAVRPTGGSAGCFPAGAQAGAAHG